MTCHLFRLNRSASTVVWEQETTLWGARNKSQQTYFFSVTFPLSTRDYLCFLQHSRFAAAPGIQTIRFHRHTRIDRSFSKNSFSVSHPGTDYVCA